jgi:hypothetical protein
METNAVAGVYLPYNASILLAMIGDATDLDRLPPLAAVAPLVWPL